MGEVGPTETPGKERGEIVETTTESRRGRWSQLGFESENGGIEFWGIGKKKKKMMTKMMMMEI